MPYVLVQSPPTSVPTLSLLVQLHCTQMAASALCTLLSLEGLVAELRIYGYPVVHIVLGYATVESLFV